MVILITGASHTGKTLLAQKMVEIYKFSSFSIDHLKMGLIRSKNTNLTPNDDEALTPYLWQIVCEIIKTAIENGQNLIIEGCYVPFSWRSDFSEKYLHQIRFIALAMSDKFIDENFDKIKKHSNDIENRLDDTTCTKENLKADNQNFIKGFLNNGEKIVLINDDYEKTINNLLSENLK
ncbi:MAG: adenylate kinase [Campylobacter sp.]|nr:adenylate kinase [Campylobacter sp.]